MTKRYDRMMTASYGKFWPGSAARALRMENARQGMRTCYFCLTAFAPEAERVPSRGRRLPWTYYYCTRAHAIEDHYLRDRRPTVQVSEDADGELVVVLDLRGCRGCSK